MQNEWLRRVRARDPGAVAAFVERCRPRVARKLERLLGPGDVDHEDLLQESLIEVVRSMDHFRGQCSLTAWILTITMHVAVKHVKKGPLSATSSFRALGMPWLRCRSEGRTVRSCSAASWRGCGGTSMV